MRKLTVQEHDLGFWVSSLISVTCIHSSRKSDSPPFFPEVILVPKRNRRCLRCCSLRKYVRLAPPLVQIVTANQISQCSPHTSLHQMHLEVSSKATECHQCIHFHPLGYQRMSIHQKYYLCTTSRQRNQRRTDVLEHAVSGVFRVGFAICRRKVTAARQTGSSICPHSFCRLLPCSRSFCDILVTFDDFETNGQQACHSTATSKHQP